MTLYEKRGRRYYPVSEWEQLEALPEGFHLIYVQPGYRTVKQNIEPDRATVEAALLEVRDAMLAAISTTGTFRIHTGTCRITKRERAILDDAERELGWQLSTWIGKAPVDVIEAGLAVLREHCKHSASTKC